MSGFLIGHEFDEGHVLRSEAGLEKFGFGEAGEAVVEEIELDPFLSTVSAEFLSPRASKSNLV